VFVAESNPRSVTTDLTEQVVGALFQLDPRADAEAFALLYNYLFFVVPFYAGLHITYMDKNLFLRAVGDKAPHLLPPGNCNQRTRSWTNSSASSVRSACRAESVEDLHEEGADCFGRFAWFPPLRGVLSSHLAGAYLFIRAFTPGAASVAQPLRLHLVQALDGLLLWYALAYGCVLAAIGVASYIIRKTHEIHVHHYLFGTLRLASWLGCYVFAVLTFIHHQA
jgi:hypothetical protein